MNNITIYIFLTLYAQFLIVSHNMTKRKWTGIWKGTSQELSIVAKKPDVLGLPLSVFTAPLSGRKFLYQSK
jgi:hypothetical protein